MHISPPNKTNIIPMTFNSELNEVSQLIYNQALFLGPTLAYLDILNFFAKFKFTSFLDAFESKIIQLLNLPPLTEIKSSQNYEKLYNIIPHDNQTVTSCCKNLQVIFNCEIISLVQFFIKYNKKLLFYYPKLSKIQRSKSVTKVDENVDIYTLICGTLNPNFDNSVQVLKTSDFIIQDYQPQNKPLDAFSKMIFNEKVTKSALKTFLVNRRLEAKLTKQQPISSWKPEKQLLKLTPTFLKRSNSTEFQRATPKTSTNSSLNLQNSTRISSLLQSGKLIQSENQLITQLNQRHGLLAPTKLMAKVCKFYNFNFTNFTELTLNFNQIPLQKLVNLVNACYAAGCYQNSLPAPIKTSKITISDLEKIVKIGAKIEIQRILIVHELQKRLEKGIDWSDLVDGIGELFIEIWLLGGRDSIYDGISQIFTKKLRQNKGWRQTGNDKILIQMKNQLKIEGFISLEVDCQSSVFGVISKEKIQEIYQFCSHQRNIFDCLKDFSVQKLLFGGIVGNFKLQMDNLVVLVSDNQKDDLVELKQKLMDFINNSNDHVYFKILFEEFIRFILINQIQESIFDLFK